MPGLKAVVSTDASVCRAGLVAFRSGLYRCFRRRGDALFELVDAVLTAQGPVGSLVELSQEKAFRRGHGALYDALAGGDVDVPRVAGLIASSWRPADEGPVKIAVDVSAWPRPDALTSPGLCHCYTACRCDGARRTIPGWPFSFAAGLEWGASSWTALLDAVRVGPDDDATLVAVRQVAAVLARLEAAGTLAGRPAPVFVSDSGYDLTRIAYLAGQAGLGCRFWVGCAAIGCSTRRRRHGRMVRWGGLVSTVRGSSCRIQRRYRSRMSRYTGTIGVTAR